MPDTPDSLATLTLLLSLFLAYKVYGSYREHGKMAFLHPPVITSIMHFFLAFVVPNFEGVFASRWHYMSGLMGSQSDMFIWLNYATFVVAIAAGGMWLGYEGRIASRVGSVAREYFGRMRFLAASDSVGLIPILVLLSCGFLAPYIRIKLGIFGFFYDQEAVTASLWARQWIELLDNAGFLGLLLLSFAAFDTRSENQAIAKVLLGIALMFFATLGLVSAVKSQMVLPFIVVGTAYFVSTHRFPKALFGIACLMVVVSYPFVTPLRRRCLTDDSIDIRSVSSVLSTVLSSVRDTLDGEYHDSEGFATSELVDRQNLMVFTGISLKFSEQRISDADRAMIRKPLLLCIPMAFVPRGVWKGKPLNNIATWYNITVLGAPRTSKTAVGMGPESYLYIAGGIPLVFLGFWLIGVIQKVIFCSFANGAVGSWVIYFGMLGPITTVNSDFGATLAGILRLLPCLLLMQYIIVRCTVVDEA